MIYWSTLYGMDRFYNCETLPRFSRSFNHGNCPSHIGCDFVPYYRLSLTSKDTMDTLTSMRPKEGIVMAILTLFYYCLDGLINFSRSFLSANRGGMMDAPLILTTTIIPTEIDKEALNVDTMNGIIPVSFYEGNDE